MQDKTTLSADLLAIIEDTEQLQTELTGTDGVNEDLDKINALILSLTAAVQNIDTIEVSDGSIQISHEQKCKYISELTKQGTVLSEVGSKDAERLIPPYKWIELMQREIDAGSWKVVAEARETGNVGIYRETGEVRSDLIEEILTKIPQEKILWEAPKKSQQVWFIKLMGANVNLGNISPFEVISLECLRLGLRGDTFFDNLPNHLIKKVKI